MCTKFALCQNVDIGDHHVLLFDMLERHTFTLIRLCIAPPDLSLSGFAGALDLRVVRVFQQTITVAYRAQTVIQYQKRLP